MVVGLLRPRCIDGVSGQSTGKRADVTAGTGNNFGCPSGSQPEFRPVSDMHIGIISSSLGLPCGRQDHHRTPRDQRMRDRSREPRLHVVRSRRDVPGSEPACKKIQTDPECQKNGGYYGPGEDQLNVRFHRMKERFGIDPQFPISRYVDGLTRATVPDRSTEHVSKLRVANDPRQGREIAAYSGTGKCTNPIFAKGLPRAAGDETCNLPRSSRNPALVVFATIGGVPNELLHAYADDEEKSRLTDDDWSKILGRDPAKFSRRSRLEHRR